MNAKGIRKILIVFFFSLVFIVRPASAYTNGGMLTVGLALSGLFGAVIGAIIVPSEEKAPCEEPEVIEIAIDNVVFTEPGTQTLVLHNDNDQPVTVDSILLSNKVHGISVGNIESCQPIPANGTCSVPLEATVDAHGIGTAIVIYNDSENVKEANISVVNTSLVLYKCIQRNESKERCVVWDTSPVSLASDIILEAESSPQFFKYTNVGKFSWQKENLDSGYISWKPGFEFPAEADVGLNEDTSDPDSKCCNSRVKPNESCVFYFVDNDHKDHPGDWGLLKILGKNLGSELNKGVLGLGGLEIVINTNPTDYHLGYRSLKVVNTVEGEAVTLNKFNVSFDQNSDEVEYCPATAGDECFYKSGCKGDGTTVLADGGSCLVWFKAEPSSTLGTVEDIEVTVEAGGTCTVEDPPDETDTFKITYEQALYAGGRFTEAGGADGADKVAKWNGSSWSPLTIGVDDYVRAFAVTASSDLYVGGMFTSAGGKDDAGRIAKWNGTGWLALGSGISNGFVTALAAMGADLYVGGYFYNAGGDYDADNIAKWDGVEWSPLDRGLGSTVYAITSIGTDLYVGGSFYNAGGEGNADRVAKWDGTEWSALGTGLNSTVYALTSLGTDLYVGGTFSDAGGDADADRIAKWDGTEWSALGTGTNRISNGTVSALIFIGTDLYAGGSFFDAGDNYADKIAKWDGTEWSPLYRGLSTSVEALASMGTDLYVGGYFYDAGFDNDADKIAKWDGTEWSALGTGLNGDVHAITTAPSLLIVEHMTPSP